MYFGELTYLRAIEPSDIDAILEYGNDYELRRLLGPPVPWSRKNREEWLESRDSGNPWKNGVLQLAIVEKSTNMFLGLANLSDIRRPHSRAELGVSIYDSKCRSKGYGSDATRVLVWVGFNILGLHSIYLDLMEDNEHARRTYEKIGFKEVGILRETEYIDGAFKGLLIMDILRDEFEKANLKFKVKMKL